MLPISVCLIGKNEERCITDCLTRLSAFPWEIIFVDTGSTDHTAELASGILPQIFHFDWCDDFSAARNYAASLASNDWILSVDCDELLDLTEKDQHISLFSSMPYETLTEKLGTITQREPYTADGSFSYSFETLSRFYNRKFFRWTGTIHEQLTPWKSVPRTGFPLPLRFEHQGYCSPEVRVLKARRNLKLLLRELESFGPDPYIYYQIGQSYFSMQDLEHACSYFELGISMKVDPSLEYVRTMVESYGYCLLGLKRWKEALLFENLYEDFSSHADFLFLMGLIYMNNSLFDRAVQEFQNAVNTPAHSIDGVNSYKAYYNMGVIQECRGFKEDALKYYQSCGNYKPALAAIRRVENPGGNIST